MKEAFRALLKSSPAVSAITTRIHWIARPQNEPLPAVVLTLISDVEDATLDGPTGLSQARVQVDAWDTEPAKAEALARSIRDALNGHSDGVLYAILFASARDSYERDEKGARFRVSQDFRISYERIPP